MLESACRSWVAARLFLRDVLRRRFTVALIFLVPALFDAVALTTTAARPVQVTIAGLRDPLLEGPVTPRPVLDLDLLDDGGRRIDQRQLSLVFLGHAAACFLACFLAFSLVHRRREVDARLVLAGYRTHEVMLGKLGVLLLTAGVLAAGQLAVIGFWVPMQGGQKPAELFAGLFLGGMIYGAVGLLIGGLARQELAGVLLIVFFANVDPGWLQNPIYFAQSQRPDVIRALPAYASTQLSVIGAFFPELDIELLWRGMLYAAVLLAAAFVVFWLRIRPRRAASDQCRARGHFGKILLFSYALWIAAFELVGRWAQTLPTHDLTTAWDRAIPLVPAFIWPYEACYALPLVALLLFRDWHRFNVGLLAIAIASLLAFTVYFVLPVAFPRPVLGTSLSERVLAAELAGDFSPGANKLPSLHVAISWILLFAVWGEARRRWVDLALAALVVAITVSTVLVKQHLLIDVFTAVPLAAGAFALAGWLYRRPAPFARPECSP